MLIMLLALFLVTMFLGTPIAFFHVLCVHCDQPDSRRFLADADGAAVLRFHQ